MAMFSQIAVTVGLIAIVAALLASALSRRIEAPLALLASACIWPFVNEPLEGPTLWVTTAGHRVTVAELAVPAAITLGLIRILYLARNQPDDTTTTGRPRRL